MLATFLSIALFALPALAGFSIQTPKNIESVSETYQIVGVTTDWILAVLTHNIQLDWGTATLRPCHRRLR